MSLSVDHGTKKTCVVCDVGKVLIDFSLSKFASFLTSHGAQLSSAEDFIVRVNMHAYERGEIGSGAFLANIAALLPEPENREILIKHWQDIFVPIPEMIGLLERVKERFQVFLLSNTNELHWRYLEERFALTACAHGCLTSFEAGAMKPDPRIFSLAVTKFGLTGANVVFIDDLEPNVKAGAALGWVGIVHRSVQSTEAQLRNLGLL